MSNTTFQNAGAELDRWTADIRQLIEVRHRLARVEWDQSLWAVRRMAIGYAIAALCILTALPLALFLAAGWLSTQTAWEASTWIAVFAAVLGLGGVATLLVCRRRFAREFVGFKDTVAELQEDLAWLKDITRPDA